jgi:ubiquinone biosynthesis protein UbiJ
LLHPDYVAIKTSINGKRENCEISMLLTMALPKAAKLINFYLKLDPAALDNLRKLSGNILKIEMPSLSINFYIKITDTGIELIQHYTGLADTIIRGTPLSLLSLLNQNNEKTHAVLQNQNITIIGNIEIAQEFKNIFSTLEIDWEEYLSKIIGDPLAHALMYKLHGFSTWIKSTEKSMQRNLNEYLHEEVNLFPPHLACSDLYTDIDDLRDEVERLSQRVQRIQKKFSEQNT